MEAQPQVVGEGEHDWIFDCLITFIKSPRWKTPVVSYMEEHCLIFDNEEENKLEYTTIHQNFFKLVDELLCELVAEMGITREQFTAACETSGANPTHHRIVQQILNVDDFEAFKKMMIKKNMQMEELALKELLSKQAPNQSSPEEVKIEAAIAESAQQQQNPAMDADDEQMRLVLEMSRVAQQEANQAASEEEEMIRLAIEASKQEEERRIQAAKQEQEQSAAAMQASLQAKPEAPKQEPAQQVPAQANVPAQQQPEPQVIEARIDPEQQRKEQEKLKQLAELKKKREEEKKNPPKQAPAQPSKLPEETKKFVEEQKEVISKIRKPKVEDVAAFDEPLPELGKKEEDPFAGLSFAEALRQKRAKLEEDLKKATIADSEAPQGKSAEEQPLPEVQVDDDGLEARKARLQAQRKALLEKRKQEREKELLNYNQSQSGAQLDAARNSFYAQMIKMDAALPKKQAASQGPAQASGQAQTKPKQAASENEPARQGFNLDDIEAVDLL